MPVLSIRRSAFENIICIANEFCYVLFDQLTVANVTISSSNISNSIILFYYGRHSIRSEITVNEFVFSSNAYLKSGTLGLFYFYLNDLVQISGLTINYQYDADQCSSIKGLSADIELYECPNPLLIVHNNGDLALTDTKIHANVVKADNATTNGVQYLFESSNDDVASAVIINQRIMKINKMFVQNSMAYDTIYNEGKLWIDALFVDEDGFDANGLQSWSIIRSVSISSSVITNSYFVGSYSALNVDGGSLNVSNSSFDRMTRPMTVQSANDVRIVNCTFSNFGPFFGSFIGVNSLNLSSMTFMNIERLDVVDNTFNGYNEYGMVRVQEVDNVVLDGNAFKIDVSGPLHNADPVQNGFNSDFVTVYFESCGFVQITKNIFEGNDINVATPWIIIDRNLQNACVSGNVFTNYALHSEGTNITSCFRPALLGCTVSDCNAYHYGQSVSKYADQIGKFNVDEQVPYLMTANHSNIALDNIEINILHEDPYPVVFGLNAGTALVVDSQIHRGYDISYDADDCIVIHNDRLANDTAMIARLMIECNLFDPEHDFKIENAMNSEVTKTVEHFSAYTLWFYALSTSYYPGMNVQFNYTITDRLNNVIADMTAKNITVTLVDLTESFVTKLWIDGSGRCQICEDGVWLSSVTMESQLDEAYSLGIEMSNNELILKQNNVIFNITGCPARFGVDSRNLTCSRCDAFTYNDRNNSVRECMSCDPNINKNIHCDDGEIIISKDYWIGFEEDRIISGRCPSDICCQLIDGCDYISDSQSLCATNRDIDSILCSHCIAGYSESVSLEMCVQCRAGNCYQYFFFSILLSIITILFLAATNTMKTTEIRNIEVAVPRGCCGKVMWLYNKLENQSQDITMVTLYRISIYYEQAVSQILSTGASTILMSAISGIFDFSVKSTSSGLGIGPWCFIVDIDAKGKVLCDLLTPAMTLVLVILAFAITRWISADSCKFRGKFINFPAVLLSGFLYLISPVLLTLSKLLSCETVGSQSVHFYFGFEACYGLTWTIALLAMLSTIILFGALFIFGRTLKEKQRYDPNSIMYQLTKRFKAEYWYWEYIIFLRRVVIALFVVLMSDDFWRWIFVIVLTAFVALQVCVRPFASPESNRAEFMLLACLPVFVIAEINSVRNYAANAVAVILSLFVLIPIPIVIYCSYRILRNALEMSPHIQDYQSVHDRLDETKEVEFAKVSGSTSILDQDDSLLADDVSDADASDLEVSEVDSAK